MTTWKPYIRTVTASITEVDFNIETEDMYETKQTEQTFRWTTYTKKPISETLAEILEKNYQELMVSRKILE